MKNALSWLSTIGPVRAAVQPWRLGGTTWLTVVAKASCRLADPVAKGITPDPLVFVDGQGNDPALVSEMAPYKPRPEIVMTAKGLAADDGQVLVTLDRAEKRLWERRRTAAKGTPIADPTWAPAPAAAPQRRRFLMGALEPDFRAAIPELSDPAPWLFMQVASEVGWVDAISPGDVVTVERCVAGEPRATIRSRLPAWTIAATLSTKALATKQLAPRRFPLIADTLHLQLDTLVASIVWRGALEVAPHDLGAFLRQDPALAPRIEVTLDGFGGARTAQLVLEELRANAARANEGALKAVAIENAKAHATAPIDPKQITGPIAPFLLKQLEARSREKSVTDRSATPWEMPAARREPAREVHGARGVTRTIVDAGDAPEAVPPARVAAPLIEAPETMRDPREEQVPTPVVELPPARSASLDRPRPRPQDVAMRIDPAAMRPVARPVERAKPSGNDVAARLRSSGVDAARVDQMLARLHRGVEAPPPEDDA